jgi:hypothetical protein
MKTYSVQYFPNGNMVDARYVGSLADYKDGGTCDFIPMGRKEAEQLLQDLDNYVRNEEQFTDRDAVLYAYEHNEWGFAIDELEITEKDD